MDQPGALSVLQTWFSVCFRLVAGAVRGAPRVPRANCSAAEALKEKKKKKVLPPSTTQPHATVVTQLTVQGLPV